MKDGGKPRMNLSAKIFLGLALGIVFGIFFGEAITFLGVIGEVFIQLLQVTVLPFITLSLIAGLGRLTYGEALSLAKKCGALLLLLWVIAIIFVILMPLAFPEWKSASFFSTTLVEEGTEVNFLELYIPANPFYSLSNTIVPAVVLFSLMVGIALIGVDRKQGLLDILSTLLDALGRVTGFVIRLAPIGVFAIAANAAGTINLEDLGRLQVYLLTYIVASMVLTFWVLPALVTNLTPLNYREVVGPIRGVLLTAFATGNLLVVLPILTERGIELLRQAELNSTDSESAVEVLVPISFIFPTIGMLLSMSFIPFAAWYVGSTMTVAQYPSFIGSGIVSFFGTAIVAMPFLLNLFRLPADLFQLFVSIDVFSGRFGTLLAAMHVWVLALLGSCAISGHLRWRWGKFVGYVGVSIILTLATLGATRMFFTYAYDPEYTKYQAFVEMELKHEPVEARMLDSPPSPLAVDSSGVSRLDVIQERGRLRVCFLKDRLPFAFRNAAGKLVGFDIEVAHLLAKALNVTLDLVFIQKDELDKVDAALNAGSCDIAMAEYALSPDRTQRVAFSVPYLDVTVGFLVEDYRRSEFVSWEAVRSLGAIKIGIPTESRYYNSLAESLLPQATFVQLDSPREFFTNQIKDLDALIFLAESGSAWTLVYPRFAVVVPFPNPLVIPLAYPMPHGERELVDYVNAWIELKKKDHTIDSLFNHWILGQGAKKKEPRWSVIRNVLHWVD